MPRDIRGQLSSTGVVAFEVQGRPRASPVEPQCLDPNVNELATRLAETTLELRGASLLREGGGGDLVGEAVVVRLGVGPVVLGKVLHVLDVLSAPRAVVEGVVPQAGVDAGVVGEG